ncbi:MAG: phosphotransferase [Gammaproteobacteria bacterium]|nr:phosphotransferase [Gammaproteobacteria bacterium]
MTAYPQTWVLNKGLAAVLEQCGESHDRLVIIERRANIEASTFPSEIVTCQLDGQRIVHLFCKYSIELDHDVYGHRGGVEYEARVYRSLLQQMELSVPKFYGFYQEPKSDRSCLVLGYLANTVRVSRTSDPDDMLKAARWLGCFHAHNETHLQQEEIAFLHRYDADSYLGWAHRALLFAKQRSRSLSWLHTLCARFENQVDALLSEPLTIIHGEFYSQNVMVHQGNLYPLDWESAAIAAGELDLASLTDRWPDKVTQSCEKRYRQARWEGSSPEGFHQRLQIARIYTQLRWLGDRFEISTKNCHWRLEQLRDLGLRLGYI